VAGVALFVATRILLDRAAEPFFDPDSYKYLAGADALRAGTGLPAVFTTLAVTGGALQAVPGYAWFAWLVWLLTGGISLRALTIVQSAIALVGFFALAHLFARWMGLMAAAAVFTVLCLSPSVAWLEHSLLPDALAAPLYMIAAWLSFTVGPTGKNPSRGVAGAVGAGVVMAAEILLRTSSQVYAIFPPLIVLQARAGRSSTATWIGVYVLALALPLVPAAVHNHRAHGVYAVSKSTGRNLYFNAAWAGTIDRDREQEELGVSVAPGPRGAYALSEAALARALRENGSLPDADAALRARAVAAYARRGLVGTATDRLRVLAGLFAHDEAIAAKMMPLQPFREWYLGNSNARPDIRRRMEKRFQHQFSPEFEAAAEYRAPASDRARAIYSRAVDLFTLDGTSLLIIYALSIVTIYWRSLARWQILLVVAAPPAAFLVVYTFFGTPLYRYQAGLHPLMLATFVAALVPLLTREPRRRSAPSLLQRRLRRG